MSMPVLLLIGCRNEFELFHGREKEAALLKFVDRFDYTFNIYSLVHLNTFSLKNEVQVAHITKQRQVMSQWGASED